MCEKGVVRHEKNGRGIEKHLKSWKSSGFTQKPQRSERIYGCDFEFPHDKKILVDLVEQACIPLGMRRPVKEASARII